ncbi:DUF7424 family protein [Fervidobacterium gondwanense]|uniref:DUF7424 domain-containing protein n=1 Tax=Fervidobacterium gondwanense DSM 13020 TaxID=1121883 RepID=A0A1M7TAB5_FERGO|nr:hypothetical protein [Fervidobacterium gondwanense]SHN67641.1 hypothetical protein SAMN02745226_01769 [Fervidobacterium gondwanense DSM 13020]
MPEVYISAIYDFATGQADKLSVWATLKISVSDRDSHDDYADEITEILSKRFETTENVRYDSDGTYYVADVEITTDTSKLISFSLKQDGTFTINFNKEELKAANEESAAVNSNNTVSENEITFTILVVNDLKKNIVIEPQGGIYIDKVPYPFPEKMNVKSRSRFTVVVTDLFRDYLVQKGSAPLFKIYW